MSDPGAEVTLNEYMVACYGTTEYPEDMTPLTLSIDGSDGSRSIAYEYRCREDEMHCATSVSCVIPPVETKVSMGCEKKDSTGYIREGYEFSPMFTLGYTTQITDKEVVATWLRLEKAD